MSITIRQPQLSEYPLLVDLWEASVRQSHEFLTNDDIAFYRPLLVTYMPMMEIYCTDDENGIAGFIGISDGLVQALFIKPDAIGKGHGKRLIGFAIEDKQISRVDVNEQNIKACEFYERLGFRVIGRSEADGAGKPYPILNMALNYELSAYPRPVAK
ncbi:MULTISPECIES: GNAT family N-acetyltransferase [unclassified Mucilaginibacter]|uniref:GNAT family N-acetyltransferase n=1 Tax=unclassified Mucilaginibacter TaxID=2617802 RepID=UPI000A52221C|nr:MULTISPECIES: GNAT family N-acetyltransferase [unclassified Mucilaginibacter]PLW89259.1 MAG: GNAT family N-acetyltransferase [Mucilaginibacter sp.]HEK19660.1 GNAT family N-acetyltransferase [Bacteroidota bacterium]